MIALETQSQSEYDLRELRMDVCGHFNVNKCM